MRTRKTILAFVAIFSMLFGNISPVLAVPPIPSSLYGTVKLDGVNVAPGTTISAWIGGVQYASAASSMYLTDSVYALDIPGDDPSTPAIIEGGVEGSTIVFKIGSFTAVQTAAWHSGSNVELNLTANSTNQAPVVTDIPNQTIAEGSSFATINLDNYVSDVDNTDAQMTWTFSGNVALTVSIVNRVATINIPDVNWFGSETITFRATDPGSAWDDDPATFTVTSVNDLPVAGADSYSVEQNGVLNVAAPGVLTNDTDIDGPNPLTAVKVSDPTHGIVTLNPNGSFTYTPTIGWIGADSFTYKASDGTDYSNTVAVSIDVTNVNETPTNITLSASSVAENLPVNTLVGTLTTTDPDIGDTFTYSLVAGTGDTGNASFVIGGVAGNELQTNAIFNYEVLNTYSIRLRTTDQGGLFFDKVFPITIINANDPPVITEGASTTVIMSEDAIPNPFELTLNATDVDIPANTLTWSILTQALNGTASVSGTGPSKAIVYAPVANYNGSDSFVVQVSDGAGGVATITVNVTITPDAGDTYYVNKTVTCNDSSTNTAVTPFCTIGKSAGVARAGDMVRVLAGTYAETVSPAFSGIASHPITFLATPGVTITGAPGNTTSGGAFRLFTKSYIVIDGFIVADTADYGIYVSTSNHITVTNNEVRSAGDTTANYRMGIYFSSTTDSEISGNTVHHNSSDGIRLTTGCTNVLVSGNTSYGNAEETASRAAGINLLASSYNTIIHNITYANEDSGLQFYTGSSYNQIIGNLTYGNGDHGIDNNYAPNNYIVGNTVHGNVTAGINLEGLPGQGSGGATLANNILVDNGLLNGAPSAMPGNIRVDSRSITGTTLNYDMVYLTSGTGVQIEWNNVQIFYTCSL